MPDFRVRFIGDLGNLSAFTAAIRQQTAATAQAIEAQNARSVARLTGLQVSTEGTLNRQLMAGTRVSGIRAGNVTQEIDTINRSFRTSGDLINSYVTTYERARDRMGRATGPLKPVLGEEIVGRFDKVHGNTDIYQQRLKALAPITRQIDRITKQAARDSVRSWDNFTSQITAAQERANQSQALFESKEAARVSRTSAVSAATQRVRAADAAAAKLIDAQAKIPRGVDLSRLSKKLQLLASDKRFQAVYGEGQGIPVDLAAGRFGTTRRGFVTDSRGQPIPWASRGQLPSNAALQASGVNVRFSDIERRALAAGRITGLPPIESDLTSDIGQSLDRDRRAIIAANKERTRARNVLRRARQRERYATTQVDAARAVSEADAASVAALTAQRERAQTGIMGRLTRALRGPRANYAAGLAYAREAEFMATPLPRDVQSVFNMSPQIRQRLEREMGLRPTLGQRLLGARAAPYGSDQYLRTVQGRGLQVDSVTKNLGDNVTRVTGQVRDATGVMNGFSVAVDKNGKIVEGFGRRWGAMSGLLRQTAYDFKKVLEWTLATTVVFGTFGFVVGQIKSVNELNSSLERFAITAQTTGQETITMFTKIAKVAYDTATPLSELVKAADDIALATRRAGQSTQEWQKDILALTRAVGVLTNLTGQDTVTATEKLTAIFKQLGTEPENLIGVLNKITAVAGGNSESINDITTALSLMTEAASQAQMSLDQQIAAVQVIAQATGKTADETATAFKNLFGAILNPTSIKTLDQFGIAVKDSAGNMRPFLEIYREIQTAIETGRIPRGRVQEVVRAIAGGPRRAPDAAALLSNIFKVYETVPTSLNATNEALIANAKILDTNSAKWQQVKTLYDTRLFLLLNDTIKSLTSTFTDLAIAFGNLTAAIPTELIQYLAQLATFALVGTLIGKGFRALGFDIGFATARVSSFKTAMATVGRTSLSASGGVINTTVAGTGVAQGYGPGIMYLGRGTASPYTPSPTAVTRTLADGRVQYQIGGRGRWGPAVPQIGYNVGGGPMNRLMALRLGRGGGLLYGGAALGAGLLGGLAASQAGISPLGTIGGAMMLGGGIASMIPGLAPIGIGTMLAGGALSMFAGQETKQKDDVKAQRVALYEALQAWKTANAEVETQIELVNRLKQGIDETKKGTKDNKDAVKEWTAAVADLGFAEEARNKKWSEFIDTLNKNAEGRLGISDSLLAAARGGALTDAEQKELTFQIGNEILKQAGSPYTLQSSTPPSFSYVGGNINPRPGVPTASFQYLEEDWNKGKRTWKESGQTLREFVGDVTKSADNLKKLFEGATPRFQPTTLNAELVSKALNDAVEAQTITQDEFQTYINLFGKYVNTYGSFTTALLGFVERGRAYTTAASATGLLTVDEARNANLRLDLMERIAATPLAGPRFSPAMQYPLGAGTSPVERNAIINSLGANLKGDVTKEMLIQAYKMGPGQALTPEGKTFTQLIQEQSKDFMPAVQSMLGAWGLAWDEAKQAVVDWEDETSNKMEEARLAIESALTGITQSLSGDLLKAFADFRGGLISASEYSKIENTTQSYLDTLKAVGEEMKNMQDKELEGLTTALGENALGWAGVAASGDAVIANLLSIGQTLNLTSSQFDAYGQKVVQLARLYRLLTLMQGAVAQSAIAMGKAIVSGALLGTGQLVPTNLDVIGNIQKAADNALAEVIAIQGGARGTIDTSKSGGGEKPLPGEIYLPEEVTSRGPEFVKEFVAQAVKDAQKIQSQVPGANKKYADTLVAIFSGLQRVLLQRGLAEEYLTKAINDNTEELKKQNETKADVINRIRVGYGSFAALANVPMNAASGVSVGGPQGPITISLNVNGQILTPAQIDQITASLAAQLKSAINAG